MSLVRGSVRFTTALIVIAIGALLILALAWVPLRVRRIRLSAWLCTLISRLGMAVFNVKFSCREPEKLQRHQGLVFPNHISYFDIPMMLCVIPSRFLSKHAIRAWPFIGWAAEAVGTVFVNREDKQSRAEARRQVGEAVRAEPYPPLVLYPEGATGPGRTLLPFRYGAFDIAVQHGVPYLPCVIVYDQPEVLAWKGDESFLAALWRLACWPRPIQAQLIPLAAVHPRPGDDPQRLAAAAHHAIAAVLNVPAQMPAEHRSPLSS